MAFGLDNARVQFTGEEADAQVIVSTAGRAESKFQKSLFNFADRLRECKRLKDGKLLHSALVDNKLDRLLYLRNLLVKMYLNSGSLEEAWSVFSEMPLLDVVLWTRMMGTFNQQCMHRKTLGAFYLMLLEGVQPDLVMFLPVLEACAASKTLKEGTLVHRCILEIGLDLTSALGNSMINMYGKCGDHLKAQEVFDGLQERNVISWTALFSAYGQCGNPHEALAIFHSMQLEGVRPNRISFVAVMNSCESSIDGEEAQKIHDCVKESGCEMEPYVGNAIVNMYGKCGLAEEAAEVFHRLPEADVIGWTALISAYAQQRWLRDVLQTTREMQVNGVRPNWVTFTTVLNACEKPSSLEFGRRIHELAVESGCAEELMVGNAIVNMYGKCGSLEDAHEVFNSMARRDVVTWNAIISAYAHRVHHREPLLLFQRMEAEEVKPNRVTFVTVLYACARLKALEEGKMIHARLLEEKLVDDVIVGTALVNLYAKCGELQEARKVFDGMRREDLIAWNSMLGAYAEAGNHLEALELLQKMEFEGLVADEVTYISILNPLASPEMLETGKQVHRLIQKRKMAGLNNVAAVETALLNMYTRCGSLEDAERIFNVMEKHDIVSWTSMIMAYFQASRFQQALKAFRRMHQSGVKPDKAVLVIIFKLCSESENVQAGKMVHRSLSGSRFEKDTELLNAVMNMYGRSGFVEAAHRVFDGMVERDSESWSGLMLAYFQQGDFSSALGLFEQQDPATRSRAGFVSAIVACGNLTALSRGREVHRQAAEAGLDSDCIVGTALIDMYGKCGCLEVARAAFDRVRKTDRDLVLWTILMTSYAQNGKGNLALEVFRLLQQEGVEADDVTFVSVLNACSSSGLAEEGLQYFAGLRVDYGVEPSKYHVACLVDLLGKTGRLDEAEKLVPVVEGDGVVWMALLGACATQSDVDRGARALNGLVGSEPKNSAAYVMHQSLLRTS